jgi:signal transduction histidine kinase
VVGIGTGIGFLIVIGLLAEQSRNLLGEVELQRHIHTTELLAAQQHSPLRWDKPALLREIYDNMVDQHQPAITAAVTLDPDGQALTTYQRDAANPVDFTTRLQTHGDVLSERGVHTATVGDQFLVFAPIVARNGGERAGTFAVAWSLPRLDEMTRDVVMRQSIVAMAAVAVFVVVSLIFVNLRLCRPLAEITATTKHIVDGAKNFEIPWTTRRDAIGDMARLLVTFRENVALIDRLTAEQQQQTMRLAKALERERDYNALHGEFVAMVSHEFRTPVAIIDGAAQRIHRRAGKDTPEELQQRATKIRGAATRMIQLIDSTLSVSRMAAGAIELEIAPCDMAALLTEICQRQQEIAKMHKICLTSADLPAMLFMDAKRMDQVFTNLLSNAVKYAPHGPQIEVEARAVGSEVVVSVRDSGLGIPKNEIPKLFEKFFRASTSTGIPGTGIGLHLVKHLVELHHGRITVDSTEGEGTTFTVALPLLKSNSPSDVITAENHRLATLTA